MKKPTIFKNLVTKQKLIPISAIKLDLENPRYNEELSEKKQKIWLENQVQKLINDNDIDDIHDSILKHGVLDPIWVIQESKNKYDVIEGSRRLVTLRILVEKKIKPPTGVKYDIVLANIIPKSTPQKYIDAQRVLLQTGKKPWGPYNVAIVINKLAKQGFTPKEIAKMMGKSLSYVDKEIQNYNYYSEYKKYLKSQNMNEDLRKFTYFQRAGDAVRQKFFSNQKGRIQFFKLITPKGDLEKARIPSVALKGGLMNFNTITQDDKILNEFLTDTEMTVEDALILYRGRHIIAEFPWAKKILDVSKNVKKLNKESIEKFQKDKTLMSDLRIILKFCQQILDHK